MSRTCLKLLPTAVLLLLMVSCGPEGCYGPEAFGYNTKGVAVTNLIGTYSFDGPNALVLVKLGFTNHSGFISLKPDMSFVCSNVPCVFGIPKPGVYLSSPGKWRPVKTSAIWEIELFDVDFQGMAGLVGVKLPVLGESPPHELELLINHDEGYWVRLRRNEHTQ